jgi:citrate synthase
MPVDTPIAAVGSQHRITKEMALQMEWPATTISTFDEQGATIRGKDLVDDLIGEVTFTQMIYLHVLGRIPTPAQAKVLDSVLVTLVDHGILASVGARMVYMASPDSLQGAIAAGILSIGSQFGGVQEQVGRDLEEIIAAPDPDAKARDIVAEYRAAKRPLPGFGHPHFRPEDRRAQKLINVAESAGVPGKHIAALRTFSKAVDAALGKHITVNATAAMAAVMGEIGIPWRIMRGFAAISRAAGTLGHIHEEQQKPVAASIGMLAQELIPYGGEKPAKTGKTA